MTTAFTASPPIHVRDAILFFTGRVIMTIVVAFTAGWAFGLGSR